MAGERDLETLIAGMQPVLRPDPYVVVTLDDPAALGAIAPAATVAEDEGLTAVITRAQADDLGLPYDHVAAWITLQIHSALDAVGFTAAFSRAVADAGLSCNVLAGRHHDHLLVPWDERDAALRALRELAARGA